MVNIRPCTGASDMVKRKYCFNQEQIEAFQSQGRGLGSGKSYLPWIRAHDINSIGLTTRVPGWKTGRSPHHFLSKLEAKYFYLLEWSDIVIDIREQFPLNHKATFQIAKNAGINYPWERNTGYNTVLTTDFLISVVGQNGRDQTLARTLKYASDIRDKKGKGILEKFEIERRYWKELGVDWGIVTDFQIPETLVSNIQDCYEHRDLGYAINFDAQEVASIEKLVLEFTKKYSDKRLSEFAEIIDLSYSLTTGKCLAVIKHMLANKKIFLQTDIRWLKDACCKDFIFNESLLAEVV